VVVVLGDVMLDEFLWGRVSRISPEAPVPVVETEGESFHAGGAANVAANVQALGGEARLVGAIGQDRAAGRLEEALGAAGIDAAHLVRVESRPTTVKTRVIAQHQQVVRVDRESREAVGRAVENRLLKELDRALIRAHALVISDYNKGTITAHGLPRAMAMARKRRIPILVDPKLRRWRRYRGATIVTPNLQEAEEATGVALTDEAALGRAARRILRELGCRAVLITRGELGMSLFERERSPVHIRAAAREVFDVTGAGDTVIATLALARSAGASWELAARLANQAAGIVVGRLGTATVTPEDVAASLGG
jgi:D-beta-D-heptose 7-phosphate kinase/D-beta-D-heptose 1-phosphate adenosyltransferase